MAGALRIESGMSWEEIERRIADASQRDVLNATLLVLLKFTSAYERELGMPMLAVSAQPTIGPLVPLPLPEVGESQ